MTDTLRDWADKCEARAIDALDLEGTAADAAQLLEVAMLLDQRADYIEARGQIVDAEVVETRVKELVEMLQLVDDACRRRAEDALTPDDDPAAQFANALRGMIKVAL